jgi:vitamin B12 transporter
LKCSRARRRRCTAAKAWAAWCRSSRAGASTGFHPYASATLGSERWRQWTGGFTGGQGAWTWALGLQQLRERGHSSTNSKVQFGNFNADDDPFTQDAINASVALQINADWRGRCFLLYSDGVSHFDDGPGVDAKTAVRSRPRCRQAAGPPDARLADRAALWPRAGHHQRAGVIVHAGRLQDQQDQWTWQNTVDTPLGVVLAGWSTANRRVSGSTAYAGEGAHINGVFAGINGAQGNHSWQVNARRDTNSQFGGSSTGFAGYGYRISPAWRVSASHGTSFVAPSFNQLYFPGFGNVALQPERGRTPTLGLTWAANGHEVKLVRFDNKIRGYMTNTTLPINIPRSRIDGWTLGYEGKAGRLGAARVARTRWTRATRPTTASCRAAPSADRTGRRPPYRRLALLVRRCCTGARFDDAANTRVKWLPTARLTCTPTGR